MSVFMLEEVVRDEQGVALELRILYFQEPSYVVGDEVAFGHADEGGRLLYRTQVLAVQETCDDLGLPAYLLRACVISEERVE